MGSASTVGALSASPSAALTKLELGPQPYPGRAYLTADKRRRGKDQADRPRLSDPKRFACTAGETGECLAKVTRSIKSPGFLLGSRSTAGKGGAGRLALSAGVS